MHPLQDLRRKQLCYIAYVKNLKRRFPVLATKLRLKLETAMPVIVATAVLNNIALDAHENLPPNDAEVDYAKFQL